MRPAKKLKQPYTKCGCELCKTQLAAAAYRILAPFLSELAEENSSAYQSFTNLENYHDD